MCVPSSEGCFISYGVAPRCLPALLAGCFINFFYGLAAMRKRASRWLVRSSLTGCFCVCSLPSDKIKSTPPEKGALSKGLAASANHSARTAGIYFRVGAGGMRSKNAGGLVTKTRRRTINI